MESQGDMPLYVVEWKAWGEEQKAKQQRRREKASVLVLGGSKEEREAVEKSAKRGGHGVVEKGGSVAGAVVVWLGMDNAAGRGEAANEAYLACLLYTSRCV